MAKDVDGKGDVHVQAPIDECGGAVTVPVHEGALVTKNDEGGDTGQFRINEEEDVIEYIDGDSTAQVQVPVDEGGGDVQVPDDESGGEDAVNAPVEAGVDVANDEEGGEVSPIPVDKKA